MVKMRGAGTLFFVLFLDFCPLLGLLDADIHHTFPLVKGSSTDLSPSSKNLEEGLANILDDVLQQVVSSIPFDEATRIAGKSLTETDTKERSNTDLSSSSKSLEEGLAKILDEIPLQVSSNVHGTRRTAGKSSTRRTPRERTSVAGNSPEPAFFLGRVDRISNNGNSQTNDQNHNPSHVENTLQTLQRPLGHISEKSKGSSVSHRAASEQLNAAEQEALEEAVKPDAPNSATSCKQLLSFLQRNIVIAAVSVAGILVALGLLLLVLTLYTRRKQPLYPPAKMTYNIFIMNGRTSWQKSQEKNSKKFAGKQQELNCDCWA